MFEEEKVGEGSVYELWVFSAEFDQLKSLFPAVSAPPDSCGVFAFPGRTRVRLNRHHVQTYPGRQKAQHIFPPTITSQRLLGKNSPRGKKQTSQGSGSPVTRLSPAHGFQNRVSQVVGGHHDILGVCGTTPGKDRKDVWTGFLFLQRPISQINKKLHIRHPHLGKRKELTSTSCIV